MASQVEGGADTRLAGGLGSGGGSSQLHDIKLYTRVAFPSPRPPNDEYQRWKGDPGEQNGRHQYKLEFNIYTGTGDPNPDIGDPSDLYFDLVCSRIFAKLDSRRWEYWNMTKLRISDINYPVMEYPFNSELHLWPKADVGVQWYHRDNFKTQRSRRKDDVVEVGELIELTLKYWGNTESNKTNARGKRRKTEETSTIEPSPRPSTPSGSSQILAPRAMGAPGPSDLVQRPTPSMTDAPTPFGSFSRPSLIDTRLPSLSQAPKPTSTPSDRLTSNFLNSSPIPTPTAQSSLFLATTSNNVWYPRNPTVEGLSTSVFYPQPSAGPTSTEPLTVYEDVHMMDVDMGDEPLTLEQPDLELENLPVLPTLAGLSLLSDGNLSPSNSQSRRSKSPLTPINSLPDSMTLDRDPTPKLVDSVTLRLPPLDHNRRKEGSFTSVIINGPKYVFEAARTLPKLFMNSKKFPKASIVTWVNGMKTILPGGPKWGRNAVSRTQVTCIQGC